MAGYLSMLRGVNVGGRKVNMKELREIYESAGLEDVRTYIQSGNVLFRCNVTDRKYLEGKLEGRLQEEFGFKIEVLIRTGPEIKKVIEGLPFTDKEPERLHVTFLSEMLGKFPHDDVNAAGSGREDYRVNGLEIYLYCTDGYGRTRLNNNFFERKLKVSATTRNWRTVNLLCSLASA